MLARRSETPPWCLLYDRPSRVNPTLPRLIEYPPLNKFLLSVTKQTATAVA